MAISPEQMKLIAADIVRRQTFNSIVGGDVISPVPVNSDIAPFPSSGFDIKPRKLVPEKKWYQNPAIILPVAVGVGLLLYLFFKKSK